MENQILDNLKEHRPIERVGFGTRLGALLLDILFALIIGVILGIFIGDQLSFLVPNKEELYDKVEGLGVLYQNIIDYTIKIGAGNALFSYINVLIEMTTGSSIGKKILGIQIGNIDGTRTNIGHYFSRTVFKNFQLVFAIPNLFLAIDFLDVMGVIASIAFFIGCFFVLGEARQGFHDMLSKTAIFKKDELN